MSKIEWTNETWNPIIGCTRVSPGCANCYAETMAIRLANIKSTQKSYGRVVEWENCASGGEFEDPDQWIIKGWNEKTHFVESQLEKPLKRKKPTMYFVCSMGDLFHESVSFSDIRKVFDVIRKCPQHTFQVLTKRPERMKDFYMEYYGFQNEPNIWLGVTAENQEQANKRIPVLLQIPAKVRFVSVEPMLGAIDLSLWFISGYMEPPYKDTLNWVICGGESSHKARPTHPDWVRSLRDQCESANVPFFFKQWGEWLPWEYDAQPPFMKSQNGQLVDGHEIEIYNSHTGELNKGWEHDLDNGAIWQKVGKKKAGSLLDGIEYKQFPNV